MVLAVKEGYSPKILLLSDDIDIRSDICAHKNLSECTVLTAKKGGDLFNQLNGHIPQLAIIDSSYNQNSIEISAALKQRFNIPVILLINPENIAHLEFATQDTIDSVLSKPLQYEQLAVSIQFLLLKLKQDEVKICLPRRCNVIKQHSKIEKPDHLSDEHVHVLDKQDFTHKMMHLIDQINNKNTISASVKLQIFDTRVQENPHWKKESLNLLNRITNHIQRNIRYGDILAKDMGYQYLILFPDLDKYTISNVIKRISQSISNLLNGHESGSGLIVAAGATIFDQNSNVSQIMEHMDLALDEASKIGDGAFIINSLLDGGSERNSKKVSYANVIQNALIEDAFFIHYQPIISLADNTIRHYEALLRLQDNEGNYFQPWKIISVAEHNHQIRAIDIRILDHAMKKLADINTTHEKLNISINLSGTHFGDKSLLEDICILIDYYGIEPAQLVFEMTETAAVKDLKQASSFISRLKELGCHFGLDDFGTGYASFSYLRALPVDYLKIDGTFVKEILENPADQLFVKAIVDVAKGLNVKTIAECVEDRETLEMLTEFGVDFAQGYYIGYPEPLELSNENKHSG